MHLEPSSTHLNAAAQPQHTQHICDHAWMQLLQQHLRLRAAQEAADQLYGMAPRLAARNHRDGTAQKRPVPGSQGGRCGCEQQLVSCAGPCIGIRHLAQLLQGALRQGCAVCWILDGVEQAVDGLLMSRAQQAVML